MEPLPTGAWPIYVVSYVTRPPISRPIGVEAGRLVVLPEGYNPPMCVSGPSWFLSHFSLSSRRRIPKINTPSLSMEYTSHLSINNASVGPAHFPFTWLVLRGASPPPIGNKSFGWAIWPRSPDVVYILIDTITCIVVSLCPDVLERNNVLGISPKMLYVTNRFF